MRLRPEYRRSGRRILRREAGEEKAVARGGGGCYNRGKQRAQARRKAMKSMRITRLRTDHLEFPLGALLQAPTLSYVAEASTGARQASARIEVARTPDFGELLYDSGERADISSLGFTPPLTLAPRTRYFWRVSVRADDGDCAVSEPAWFETGKRDEAWQARWIRAPFDADVHPVLERRFELAQAPERARVYMVGLGLYELYVNGQKAGDEYLAPFYNDYERWIQVQTYDVTDLLHAGENRVQILLGNGWYKGRFGFDGHSRAIYGGAMQALLELHAQAADGEFVLCTDETWTCRPSPVTASGIYDGEAYDARLEGVGEGVPAALAQAPEGPLCDRMSPPLRICDRRAPVRLLHTPAGEQVLDFGQVMTGWVELDVDLPAGAQVTLEYGELLQNDCFYQGNLRTARQAYAFTSAGRPAHARPHFTFYGFRYVRVTGLEPVRPEDFTACVLHSDLQRTGWVETSNEKVNRLIENAFWGQIGNFVDVPTDCPQRDERMGWTGDAQVFSATASFNQYTPAFYAKYLHDMLLEQRALGGSVPFVVPDILGRLQRLSSKNQVDGWGTEHGSCAWGDAATVIPWTLYTFFGDKELLARQFENMTAWTDYIHAQDEARCGGSRLWTCGFHFADWLALDNPDKDSCFGGTDPYFVASAYYYLSASLTAKAAAVLGREAERLRYERLALEVRDAIRREYFTPTGRIAVPTQTGMVLALALDLAPEAARGRIARDLRARLEARGMHLDTGFVGTYFLLRALTQCGLSDCAYALLLQEDYPSWLYEVNMGATTVWERWNSVLPNGLVSDTGMNSMNHYAYGSVVEWMYRDMCGLNPAAPGFKRARIAPHSDARIGHARCTYDSAAGRYACGWERTQDGVRYAVTVPFDCEAEFVPESAQGSLTLNGARVQTQDGGVRLGPGTWEILWTR